MRWRWLVAEIGFFENGDFSEYFNAHSRDPAVVHTKHSGRANGEVDNSSSNVRTAIVDTHNDGLSGLKIDNSDLGAEGQAPVGGSKSVKLKALPAGRSMIPIPRGNARLDMHGPYVVNCGLRSSFGNLSGASPERERKQYEKMTSDGSHGGEF